MSKVSVVVPIYNAGNKLDKCIRSILEQTFGDFELILVNDGSTDNSLKKCRKYKNRDKRVVVIDKENGGSVAARKEGIEKAKSEYVMFVDADDWVEDNIIEFLYNETIDNDLDITICNSYRVLGNGVLFKQRNQSRYFKENKIYEKDKIRTYLADAYFHGHPFPANLWAKLYRKELLLNSGKYTERIKFLGDDLYYNLEMLLKAKRVKVIDAPLYYYRNGGFTNGYMSYFFDDVVSGYEIQKEVIEEHYQDMRQSQYNGISIMLLNTLKFCFYNLFNGKFNNLEIRKNIDKFVSNKNIIEAAYNQGAKKYFSSDYLEAIKTKDVDYLFDIGKKLYKKHKPHQIFKQIASKVLFV